MKKRNLGWKLNYTTWLFSLGRHRSFINHGPEMGTKPVEKFMAQRKKFLVRRNKNLGCGPALGFASDPISSLKKLILRTIFNFTQIWSTLIKICLPGFYIGSSFLVYTLSDANELPKSAPNSPPITLLINTARAKTVEQEFKSPPVFAISRAERIANLELEGHIFSPRFFIHVEKYLLPTHSQGKTFQYFFRARIDFSL